MRGAEPKTLLGHPQGLAVLAGTELWERFSFFGMQALLMLCADQGRRMNQPGIGPS